MGVTYFDCDVEEPNGHLFFRPCITCRKPAHVGVPVVDENRCTACGECVRFCAFNALVRLGKMVMVFPELCHGCGGCERLCPENAIREQEREIGFVETGEAGGVKFVQGVLNVGEAMSPPLIREVLNRTADNSVNIIDAPPGTSCPVVTTLRKVDYAVLVTEPTPFGVNDLRLALDLAHELKVPHGVVINRDEESFPGVTDLCKSRSVPIIGRIPDDRRAAESYSRGEMIVDTVPDLSEIFSDIWRNIRERMES
jgi:MinD superfamily P-loop ATPase